MSFFQKNYQTPTWLKNKLINQKSRRQFLKSAAGASAIAALPLPVFSASFAQKLIEDKKTDPWLSLNAVLNHLLPSSASGPGAEEIQALAYLYNIVHQQPTDEDEKTFIFKGVGWLNGYSEEKLNKKFVAFTSTEKEQILKAISSSRAGENWLNTLLGYIFEAMLSPPSYGGNPNGIGWTWLKHQAGFPLPKAGQRYFELPVNRGKVLFEQNLAKQASSKQDNAQLIPILLTSHHQVKKANKA